jgi:phospholipase C
MLDRRDFLRTTAALGAAGVLGRFAPEAEAVRLPGGSILDLAASEAPIDTVVVIMMENRSFDHYLGWLASDEDYLDTGRSLWGRRFAVNGSTDENYRSPDGGVVSTFPLLVAGEDNPWRGCGHPDPGHGWDAGRAQRDGGFLATGSGNDEFALSWYRAQDLAFYAALSRRFTVFDRYHCSVLGPTFPNREYLHSAQSGGIKNNAFPPEVGFPQGFTWPTIWDKLVLAGVSARYYYVDLPVVALWGSRLLPFATPIARYFEDAAAGNLPRVVFLDPGFVGDTRTDEHPHGDVRDGQRLVQGYVKAFVESPHWERGVLFLTYDEWGGFFDHVRPPRLRDDRSSTRNDEDNFGQAGFRVPTRMISPYARRNFVDHRLYDHSSILRFLEWRFLGAPREGKGRPDASWFLTTRDRHAKNIGWSLQPDRPDPEFDADVGADPGTSPGCGGAEGLALGARFAPPAHDLARGLATGYFERMGYPIGDWLPSHLR